MAFSVSLAADAVVIELTGIDRLLNGRRRVRLPRDAIAHASTQPRSSLEPHLDHRVVGVGAHDGARRPNRRRIGTMLGRGATGKQFWAAPSSAPDRPLLVLDLRDHEFTRAVLATGPPPPELARELDGRA